MHLLVCTPKQINTATTKYDIFLKSMVRSIKTGPMKSVETWHATENFTPQLKVAHCPTEDIKITETNLIFRVLSLF